ncbi:GlxA family transcriptional regulator [Flagellimonas nanhaiensis]|uniref:Helix-turn-helix domain-containing protein n=1 Tax=Flagellimonas nanhaiensis TaxID=2292706 RepID=A0A371JLX8_9FLAO|nr:DJ-1/PfpI family protein [Allomuricauda nanhaiensis]RDY58076.1 helix-turn-helix domain-containing protein [Allomuricauda nanhaiensis]
MGADHRVFFLVPPEVQLLDITGPAHLFYEAQEYGAEIETFYLSFEESNKQISCTGLLLGNLIPFSEFTLASNDLIFIPGFESNYFLSPNFKFENRTFLEWLREQHENGAKICSICTGAYILAHAGLLDDKHSTTHWKYLEDIQSRFPKTKILPDRLIVKDGNIYSSAGVSSGIDLALFVMEELFGPVFTTKIAKEVVIYMRRTESDPQLSVFLQYRNHIENRIHEVQDILAQNLRNKINITELAEKIHMSPRNLTRLFKKTTGITIGSYLDKLRIERAEQLLSSGSKVSAVAQECGLQSANQLRNLLKKKS